MENDYLLPIEQWLVEDPNRLTDFRVGVLMLACIGAAIVIALLIKHIQDLRDENERLKEQLTRRTYKGKFYRVR